MALLICNLFSIVYFTERVRGKNDNFREDLRKEMRDFVKMLPRLVMK